MSDTLHDAATIVAAQQREREVDVCALCGSPVTIEGRTTRYYAPLRTEGDWQHAERVIALLADEVADRSNCPRVAPWDAESVDCPAADYCIDHHPDSLPCEDDTCPAVIAAWAREKEDV